MRSSIWKKAILTAALGILLTAAGCGNRESGSKEADNGKETESLQETKKREEETMSSITITIGEQQFVAGLSDTEAAREFTARLPLTLSMSELNGNEKYYYFDESLPSDAKRPDQIREGDLMLYGSDCLVLFYETFSTSYRYTPIGQISDPQGLKEALGNGQAEVSFAVQQ